MRILNIFSAHTQGEGMIIFNCTMYMHELYTNKILSLYFRSNSWNYHIPWKKKTLVYYTVNNNIINFQKKKKKKTANGIHTLPHKFRTKFVGFFFPTFSIIILSSLSSCSLWPTFQLKLMVIFHLLLFTTNHHEV